MNSPILDLADELRLSVGRLARQLRRQSMGGLTPSQRSVLATLNRSGPTTMGRLAEIEGISRPSVTGIVGRLEGRGMVERLPDADDGRQMLARVTEEGRTALVRSREVRTAYLVERLERLSDADRALLQSAVQLMQRLVSDER